MRPTRDAPALFVDEPGRITADRLRLVSKRMAQGNDPFCRCVPTLARIMVGVQIALKACFASVLNERQQPAARPPPAIFASVIARHRTDIGKRDVPASLKHLLAA